VNEAHIVLLTSYHLFLAMPPG